jgi:hypothetical protein
MCPHRCWKPEASSSGTELVAVTKDNLDDPEVAQYLYKSKC